MSVTHPSPSGLPAGPSDKLRLPPTQPGTIDDQEPTPLFNPSPKAAQDGGWVEGDRVGDNYEIVGPIGAGGMGYRFLHLATHGLANPNVAMSSALFLAPDPDRSADPTAPDTDGQMTAQQIVNTWDLDADLVVLSACQSGLGRFAGGEGYLGFTQALFVKGARTVVLTQWDVNDQATSLLIRRFYQNLLGKRPDLTRPMPKAEALAEAKSWLQGLDATQAEAVLADAGLTRGERTVKTAPAAKSARPFEHPYYWSAFVLVGDPN